MITAQKIKQLTEDPDNIKVVESLFKAIAYQESIRDIIEPMQREILDFYQFKVSKEHRPDDGQLIAGPEQMYLADDDDFNLYLKELERGYKRVKCLPKKKGNCPLLEAESFVRDIKKQVVDYFEPQLGISYFQLSCNLESYRKYFDLLLSLFAPAVKAAQL